MRCLPAPARPGAGQRAACRRHLRRNGPSTRCPSSAATPPAAEQAAPSSQEGGLPVSPLQLDGTERAEDLPQLLEASCVAQGALLSPEASAALARAVPAASLAALPPKTLAQLMSSMAAAGALVAQDWRSAASAAMEAHLVGAQPEDGTLLGELLWGAYELRLEPSAQWLDAAMQAVARSVADGSFLAREFSMSLCALGGLRAQPGAEWQAAMAKEAEYQLAEFTADFAPADIARLANGLSSLRVQIGPACEAALMKAVYAKVRTIEDKGAVDFSLSRLDTEERSMAYDPRWNHEELSMLPNREKDKRRLMAATWQRSQFPGWGGGGQRK